MKTIQKPNLFDYITLLTLSALWGSSFITIEYSLKTYEPIIIAFGRISIAALFLYTIMYIKKLGFPKDLKTIIILCCVGLLNNSMPFFLLSWGQQYISSSTASIMLAVGPLIALILSHFVTYDEKSTFLKLFAVILGFLGVFILLGDDFLNQRHDSLYGQIAVLFAALGYISSGLIIRKISHVPTLVCSTSMFLFATISLIPFLIFLPIKNVEFFSFSLLPLIYLGIIPTALAALIRVQMVKKVGVQFMSQVAYLIPIFTIIWAWIFFDDLPKQTAWIALILVLLGLFIKKLEK
ncbi:MAG: DMT family transporter [Arcobacter sp.]|nr:DMT family transporter [Arcobacter sp.]